MFPNSESKELDNYRDLQRALREVERLHMIRVANGAKCVDVLYTWTLGLIA